MGRILKLSGVALTDNTAPRIKYRDKIESAGSLYLFDGNHSYGQFSGLPNPGEEIPNVLANFAAEVVGANEADLHHVVNVSHTDDSSFKKERTAKGGIHGILTQAGGQTANRHFLIRADYAIRDYILANLANHYYISFWQTVTRPALETTAPQSPFHFVNGSSSTSNYLFHNTWGTPSPSEGSAVYLGRRVSPDYDDYNTPVDTPRFAAVGVSGPTGNPPTDTNNIELGVGTFGAWGGFNFNEGASRILYRAYIEDLTVSGRTYAEVEAIDYALFQEAFAEGGKFYGDTYTDPATLP